MNAAVADADTVSVMTTERDASVSAEEFKALFRKLSNCGRWGADDERGALHPMTARANALAGPDEALTWVPAEERRSATFTIACRLES